MVTDNTLVSDRASPMGKPLYDAGEPFPRHRPPDDTCFVIDHFFAKLLGLADTMQTVAGRREAERRVAFMGHYLEHLRRETTGLGDM